MGAGDAELSCDRSLSLRKMRAPKHAPLTKRLSIPLALSRLSTPTRAAAMPHAPAIPQSRLRQRTTFTAIPDNARIMSSRIPSSTNIRHLSDLEHAATGCTRSMNQTYLLTPSRPSSSRGHQHQSHRAERHNACDRCEAQLNAFRRSSFCWSTLLGHLTLRRSKCR